MKQELKPISRSLLRLADKVFATDMSWRFGGDRELFMEQLNKCDSHEEIYGMGITLGDYMKDEFFDSSEWDGTKKMVARWLKTWEERRYVVLKAIWN